MVTAPAAEPGSPWGGGSVAVLGTLKINSKPSGATVKIDGVSRGKAPITVEIAAGSHKVSVSKEGFKEKSASARVTAGQTSSMTLALQAESTEPEVRKGTLFISSAPAGALLYIDGQSRGRTPLSVTVSEGLHTLKLEAEGKSPVEKRIKVDFSRSTTVRRFIELP